MNPYSREAISGFERLSRTQKNGRQMYGLGFKEFQEKKTRDGLAAGIVFT